MQMTVAEFKKLASENGFSLKRQAKGSHEIWSNGEVTVVIANHRGSILVTMQYAAHIYADDGQFSVEFPDFGSVFTWGATLEAAKRSAKEALSLAVEDILADGKALPVPRTMANPAMGYYSIPVPSSPKVAKVEYAAPSFRNRSRIPAFA
jgi:predicted RNase H-like HicB family nuclease/predicted RNA binding protein YcfA (HicA-like mRNA interferase family)